MNRSVTLLQSNLLFPSSANREYPSTEDRSSGAETAAAVIVGCGVKRSGQAGDGEHHHNKTFKGASDCREADDVYGGGIVVAIDTVMDNTADYDDDDDDDDDDGLELLYSILFHCPFKKDP
ncbi:unnamed protein product [Dibothriocephalus latus]|uniref:Uncharacterized protein n=1 Tax=Dibothriocephalus latus TaxID=60516 RepID=A0A3P7PC61_DIBLA|nr:unnamed protein product [Dibothriocephalus latus]